MSNPPANDMHPVSAHTATCEETPCLGAPFIPSETEAAESFRRFAEQVDQEVSWLPDSVPQTRLIAEESLKLETRGLTAQNPHIPVQPSKNPYQTEFWRKQTIHKHTIVGKLRLAGCEETAASLCNCHTYYTFAVCNNCGIVQKFPNRCDQFFCPECQPHLAKERKRQVEWWTATIRQPKHVVLTIKNHPDLTGDHVDELRRWFTKLRRRKFASNWSGGFYSIEVTNEGKGWHLHLHILVNARWIDSAELALQWDSITNHFGRIVKVIDCRDNSYLAEVTKYAVKGVQLASFTPDQIVTFIAAFQGKRTFGVFGELYGQRTEFAEWIATLKQARPRCQCGSNDCGYYTEAEYLLMECQPNLIAKPRPPDPPDRQIPLIKCEFRWPD